MQGYLSMAKFIDCRTVCGQRSLADDTRGISDPDGEPIRGSPAQPAMIPARFDPIEALIRPISPLEEAVAQLTPMPNEGVRIDHHFIVRSGARSLRLDNRQLDVTSAIDGAVYTYRRALFGHDATIALDGQLVLQIKRGIFLRRGDTELQGDDGRLVARALEGSTLRVIPVDGAEFKVEPVELTRDRARDSRFLFSDPEVPAEICGRIDKLNWLNSSLEVKLPGRIPRSVALFSAWWMWRRWGRARGLG